MLCWPNNVPVNKSKNIPATKVVPKPILPSVLTTQKNKISKTHCGLIHKIQPDKGNIVRIKAMHNVIQTVKNDLIGFWFIMRFQSLR